MRVKEKGQTDDKPAKKANGNGRCHSHAVGNVNKFSGT